MVNRNQQHFHRPRNGLPDREVYHTHRCAATGCREEIRRGLLMCGRHWGLVPRDIQREVLASFKDLTGGGNKHRYVVAVSQAIRAVDSVTTSGRYQDPE